MSDTEVKIFTEMVARIGQNHCKLLETPLTGFLAMKGKQYDRQLMAVGRGQLMVIGRSVNGWGTTGWLPADVLSGDKVSEVVDQTLNSVRSNSDPDPILWVSRDWSGPPNNKYKVRRSAFWRVIKKVLVGLNLIKENSHDWPSILTWSNLYKISPHGRGNPSSDLKKLQFEYCRKLLAVEVEIYRPEKILFLTGYKWVERFLEGWTQDIRRKGTPEFKHVEAIGTSIVPNVGAGKVVVAQHPQGKKETALVKEVIQAFTSPES